MDREEAGTTEKAEKPEAPMVLTFRINPSFLKGSKITSLFGRPFEYVPGMAQRARIKVGKEKVAYVIGDVVSIHPGNMTVTVRVYENYRRWVERVILGKEPKAGQEQDPEKDGGG